jgi:hypothetical protein
VIYGAILHPKHRSHRRPVFVADVVAQHRRLPPPTARRRAPPPRRGPLSHFLSPTRLLDRAPPIHLERGHCPASELGHNSLPVRISTVLGLVAVRPRTGCEPDYREEGLLVLMLILVFESLLEHLEDGEGADAYIAWRRAWRRELFYVQCLPSTYIMAKFIQMFHHGWSGDS